METDCFADKYQSVGIGGFGDLVFGSNGYFMNGRMDELRIWNTVRTQKQIQDCMNVSFARPELLLLD